MRKSLVVLVSVMCINLAHAAAPTHSQYLAQSKQSIQAENYAIAEKDARKSLALAKTPEETGNALLLLGHTFYKRKMYEQARSQWSKAVALNDPDDDGFQTIAHIALARSYTAEGKADKAIPQYQAVLSTFEGEADLDQEEKTIKSVFSLGLANAYLETRQFESARQQFSEVLKSSKDRPTIFSLALIRIGQIDIVDKNSKEALSKFNQVLNTKDTNPGVKKLAQEQIRLLTSPLPSNNNSQEINSVKIDDNIGNIIGDIADVLIIGDS